MSDPETQARELLPCPFCGAVPTVDDSKYVQPKCAQREGFKPQVVVSVKRRARSNPDAQPISAAQCIDIARLANLRMWEAKEARHEDYARAVEAIK